MRAIVLAAVLSAFAFAAQAQNNPVNPKIAPGAVMPITEKGWPRTVAEWGRDWLPKLNRGMQDAAELVARSPQCDRVEMVGMSDRSVVRASAVFFLDCVNGGRFYVTPKDLAAGVPPSPEKFYGRR